MRMLCCPCQHRVGDAEIIVLARRTDIDQSALAILRFQTSELIVGSPHLLPIRKSHLMVVQFVVE